MVHDIRLTWHKGRSTSNLVKCTGGCLFMLDNTILLSVTVFFLFLFNIKFLKFLSFLIVGRHQYFCGPLVSDVCPGFQSQCGYLCLCALLLAFDGFLRFTFGAVPTDLLSASMATASFSRIGASYHAMWVFPILN